MIRNSKIKKGPSVRELCLYALLGSLVFALKAALSWAPNIEPVTLIFLVMGSFFPLRALWTVLVYEACEILFYGLGPWTVSYLYIWPAVFVTGHLLSLLNSHSALLFAFASALWGFVFGLACSLALIPAAGISGALSWIVSGAVFDLIHGIGNFVLMLILYHPLCRIFRILKPDRM